jgi:hypothetical protein
MKGLLSQCALAALLGFANSRGMAEQIPDLFLHAGQSLDGEWRSILDPYETGFYDYRYSQRDRSRNPSRSETFYLDVKPADPGERVEYDFDQSPVLRVPGDWNTQRPGLRYYEGRYDGLPEKCSRVSWENPYDKPVFVSEFGGGARAGHHGDKSQRWTEGFQADLYRQTLPMLDQIDGLVGFTPWILVDFRSPKRVLPGIQDGFNRKGLISSEGDKKEAFFVLQEYYRKRANP